MNAIFFLMLVFFFFFEFPDDEYVNVKAKALSLLNVKDPETKETA